MSMKNIPTLLQSNTAIEMADKLRDNGKIYVVVGVLLLILLGLFFYLIRLDKKLSKLEHKINE